ncbi:acyltransferase family protein [Methylocystis heyeri]|uniref:acyltransferase family protein n=1 Tax=Methylocystis heyeri TaxID=391905 RepID=UPI0013897FCB|nr:acyltransferase family protein [Methylocystis heyeri]
MKNRPEINGLRALAVLAVILFHAGFSPFRGGYVGVDVFFVISGYLITSIIVKDVEAGSFSFWDFYERRARRILPALFLVILCCIPFARLWMMPMELKAFSASVVWVCLFVSNILFWRQSGYFDEAAELKPLLHTWSLAVEEQFYIVFPVAVLFMWRFGRNRVKLSIAIVAVASLALSEYMSRSHPSVDFFWLPTRTWELMAGALCSFVTPKAGAIRDNFLSGVGLAAIATSVLIFNKTTPVPSLITLLPVLGTSLIILFAREETFICSMLSSGPLVAVGLMSYSAYLWHQPLFAFARLRSLKEPSPQLMILLSCMSIMLAYLSWRFVETPLRRKGAMPLPSGKIAFSALGLSAVLLVTLSWWSSNNIAFPKGLEALQDRIRVNYGLSEDCEGDMNGSRNCRTSEAPEVLLWGDSFSMHLADGIRASAAEVSLIQLTQSVCGPFIGIAPTSASYPVAWAKKCMAFNDHVIEFIKHTKSLKYVIMSSPFSQFVDDDSYVVVRDGSVVLGKEVALESFRSTLDTLMKLGVTPVVFAPPPSPGFNAGMCLVKANIYEAPPQTCSFTLVEAIERQRSVRDFLHEISKNYKVVWLDEAMCRGGDCFASRSNTFIYRDSAHLSHEGSALLGTEMNFYGLLASAAGNRMAE